MDPAPFHPDGRHFFHLQRTPEETDIDSWAGKCILASGEEALKRQYEFGGEELV